MEIRTARGTCGFVSGQGRPYPLGPQRPGWCRGKGTLYSADTIGIERHNSLHRQLSSLAQESPAQHVHSGLLCPDRADSVPLDVAF